MLGGAVAGYLRNGDTDDGLWTGSMAGLFTTVPVIVLFAGIVVALVDGTALTAAVGLLVVAAMAVAVLYVVALSAIGGYVGGTVAVRKRERSA